MKKDKKDIKEQDIEMEEQKEEEAEIRRNELNIQQFMLDMQMLGDQVRDRNLVKPVFHYGDLTITNYLLWLVLGELMILNNELNEEIEEK